MIDAFDEIYLKSIGIVMEKLNVVIEKVMDILEKEDINLDTFYKVSGAIEYIISFSKNYAFPRILTYINNHELLKEKLSDDFMDISELILKLFTYIEESLANIESNIKSDDGNIDFSAVKKYLEYIGVLLNNFGHIFRVTIDYANKNIDEEEYQKEYEMFKSNLDENKTIFEKKFEE